MAVPLGPPRSVGGARDDLVTVLELRFLGPVDVVADGVSVQLGGRLESTVLALIAMGDGPVSPERLIDEVWEDSPPVTARKTLQTYVWRLRQRLPAGAVERVAGGYVIGADAAVDISEFERLVVAGGDALARGAEQGARSAFAAAICLWRGAPFGGCVPTPALRASAVRLDELRAAAVEGRLEAELHLGRHAEVIGDLEQYVRVAPLREHGWELLVVALSRCGRQADALRAYQRARAELIGQAGVEPGPALRALERDVLEQRPELVRPDRTASWRMPVRTAPSRAGRLPIPTTPLVGRHAEAQAVLSSLERHRLVTVTGVGGTGKTRLAIAVATSRASVEPVLFGDLSVVSTPSAVAHLLARTGGVSASRLSAAAGAGRHLVEELIDALADANVLFVVDNCEHVLEHCSEIVERMLAGCAGVRVLATSRERLGVAGEQLLPLGPLAVPGDDGIAADAVTLFVQRATEAYPDFEMTASNRAAVVEICRRLDGLPLALELAASRMSHLSPASIVDRLDRSLSVVAARGPRAGRHRSLQATLDWSYDLLSHDEQRLLGRLAVFAGRFDLQGIEACCMEPGLAASDAVELVGGLVDKSLVVADHTALCTRYRLLETVRHYAEARLSASSDEDEMRAAHCEWCLVELERIPWDERLLSAQLLDRLGDDLLHDLRRTLRWAVGQQRGDLVARLVASLALLLNATENVEELPRLFAVAVDYESSRPAGERFATVAAAFAILFRWRGQADELDMHRERLAALVSDLPDGHAVTAQAYATLASLCARSAEHRPAMERYADLALRHAPHDARRLRAMATCQKVRALLFRGDHVGALQVLETRARGPDDGEFSLTQELALAHHLAGHHARALALAENDVDQPSTTPNRRRLSSIYAALAAQALGDHQRATLHLRHAVSSLTARPHPSGTNDCILALGALAALDGRHTFATALLAGLSPTSVSTIPLAVVLEHYQQLAQRNVSVPHWQRAAAGWDQADTQRILHEATTQWSSRAVSGLVPDPAGSG